MGWSVHRRDSQFSCLLVRYNFDSLINEASRAPSKRILVSSSPPRVAFPTSTGCIWTTLLAPVLELSMHVLRCGLGEMVSYAISLVLPLVLRTSLRLRVPVFWR